MQTLKYTWSLILSAIILWSIPSCQQTQKPDQFNDIQEKISLVKQEINLISSKELKQLQEDEEMYILIDVRELAEHDAGHIPGSVLIPRGLVEFRILNETFWDEEGMYVPEKTDKIILYCRSGNRSALATEALKQLGFKDVNSLEEGFLDWKKQFPDAVSENVKKETEAGPVVTSSDDAGSC